jgi:hypothetical protein
MTFDRRKILPTWGLHQTFSCPRCRHLTCLNSRINGVRIRILQGRLICVLNAGTNDWSNLLVRFIQDSLKLWHTIVACSKYCQIQFSLFCTPTFHLKTLLLSLQHIKLYRCLLFWIGMKYGVMASKNRKLKTICRLNREEATGRVRKLNEGLHSLLFTVYY